MWSGLGWVVHTKYHPSYTKYTGKLSFLWPCPGSEMRSRWKVCCTSTMIVQLFAPSMCKYVKRFGLSRAHKIPPVLYKVYTKTKFFVTLSWIWNEVKVKMKGMLHIYNDCTIVWHQVCANMWNGLGWVAHTKYNPSYFKYTRKLSFCDLVLDLKWGQGQNERYVAHPQWLYNCLAPSMCKYMKRFGLSRTHKIPPVLYKVYRKTKFFATLSWIWNEVKVKMKGMLHIYNDCTIESRTQSTTHIRDAGIPCTPFWAFTPRGTTRGQKTKILWKLVKILIVQNEPVSKRGVKTAEHR